MKKIFISIILFFAIFNVNSQSLVPQFSKTVVFIYLQNGDKEIANGTGFLVDVPAKNGSGKYIYLVTAKHVVKDKNGNYFKNIIVKYNTLNHSSESSNINLQFTGDYKNVFTHEDESVDLVVIPLIIANNKVDYLTITHSLILKRSDYKNETIDVGTDVFFSGLFTPYIGSKNINPIFRFGKLCLVPNEKIEFVDLKRELLLIESSTFGGNSGSPVIFNYNKGGKAHVRLAGVVLGSFNQKNLLKEQDDNSLEVLSSIGISAITPSEFILDILNSPELLKQRTK